MVFKDVFKIALPTEKKYQNRACKNISALRGRTKSVENLLDCARLDSAVGSQKGEYDIRYINLQASPLKIQKANSFSE